MTDYNPIPPSVMHIDLNSCFATVEQQAHVTLRGRPLAITNRLTDNSMIVTASYEAKAYGVKTGMRLSEARALVPGIIALETDPPKYRYVYHKLMNIMNDYSAHVRMKSIDEGVIDFDETTDRIQSRDLADIGYEIKQRLRMEIGSWMRCNVGISTNRFLAKLAASLHKPDGLDEINAGNLRTTLATLDIEDLTGIAHCNRARLAMLGIYTPLEFLDSDEETLRKMVFKSIDGTAWYWRLRGYEVDKRDFAMKSVGRQYVLERYGMSPGEVLQRLHNLCESVGEKLRVQGLVARGVQVHARSYEAGYFQNRQMSPQAFYTNQDIYERARKLLETAVYPLREIGVSCYGLEPAHDDQISIFRKQTEREHSLTEAIDIINNRYGERSIHSVDTLETAMVRSKIPFGSTRYL